MFPITSNSLDALHSRLPPSSSNGNAARKVRVDTSSTTTSLIDQLVPPPVCPEYLKMTTYADLVHEQHELALQRLPFDNYMKGDSFSSKHHPDNMLACNLGDIRLPSLWNGKDRAKHIALEGNGLVLKYIGKKRSEDKYHPLTQLHRSGKNRSACWIHPCKLSHTTTVWPVLL